MKVIRFLLTALCAIAVGISMSYSQAENVPATHPVYTFLKRMEVRGLIVRYHDAILPLSRKEVGEFLSTVQREESKLTEAERGWLHDFLQEFEYDIKGTTTAFSSLIDSGVPGMTSGFDDFFSAREKYIYAYRDSNLTFFVNGILNFDGRGITGDALGSKTAEYLQFGGILRGTIYNHLGFSLQGTNAQFSGSRELLARDPVIGQIQTLGFKDIQNFDLAEGYVRYDGGIVSAEVGQERVLWGNGYDQQMVVSDNVRQFPFVRADFQYKSIKYTFMHAWLLGFPKPWTDIVSPDSALNMKGDYIADKYLAAHRLEFSFPHLFDVGFSEMVVYSYRGVDLSYLNPFMLFESAQRNRGDRDNGLWSFDIQTHFLAGLELTGTVLFDDLHFDQFFQNRYNNKNAYQFGMMLTDPLSFPNTSLMVEWTHVQPYVFSHDYSIEENYTSYGSCLGPRIGPNSDSWFARVDYLPSRNLTLSLRVTYERHGDNVYDSTGALIKNVGGSLEQGHRANDPVEVTFLDGILMKTRRVQLYVTYQIVRQTWIDGWYEYEAVENTSLGTTNKNNTFGARLRLLL